MLCTRKFIEIMIISHKYKFIFIKTLKTAGTSIEVFLSQICGESDVVTPIWPPVEPHQPRNFEGFSNHNSALKVKTKVSLETWNGYFKFCVERNPWDKTLSHYHMLNEREGGTLSIEEYFKRGKFAINYNKYTGADGEIMVDKVIKFESLRDELTSVFEMLGIPFDGTLGVNAKSEYRKDRRHYREVLTGEQIQLVKAAFANEIKCHKYDF